MNRVAVRRALACALLACGAAASAQPSPQVTFRVANTDPAARTTLGSRQPFYLRIEYESEVPVRFRAEGFSQGALVERGASYNPAPVYPAGKGEALAWLAFDGDMAIDEIRITVSDARWTEIASERVALDARWSRGAGRGARTAAPWAQRLSDEQQQRTSDGLQAAGEGGLAGDLLIWLMGASIPAYLLLQAYLLVRLRNGWRTAAMVPLLGMVPLVLFTIAGAIAGANLWPLMMLFLTPLAAGYLVALWIAWLAAGRGERGVVARSP